MFFFVVFEQNLPRHTKFTTVTNVLLTEGPTKLLIATAILS